MCTLLSVLCKYQYSVLEGQQNTIQTCVLSYLYCVSTVYQRGNRIQYKHVYSHICTVQVQVYQRGNRIQYKHVYSHICTVQVQCTRGAIEYIQTCVLSYLYCVSMVYQSANRIQYKHVYSHICTVQVQCTRGAIEYNTNMCTLISVLCEYGVLEGQQNTIQTCVLSYLYCASTVYQRGNRIQYKHVYSRTCTAQVQCTRGAYRIQYKHVLSYLYCESMVYQRGNRIQYKHVYSHICTVQVRCSRGAIEYNTNMYTLISVLCKYSVLEGQQNTIQTCVLSYLYCASTVYQRGNRIQYKHVYSHICTVQVQCTRGAIESNTYMCTLVPVLCKCSVLEQGQQNTIQTCVLSYLYCVSTVYQRGNRIQYKHVYSHICAV